MENQKISPEEAVHLLWNQGILHWMLHDGQKSLYDSYINCQEKTIVWNCSRRFGKSFTLCVIALEVCLRKPNAVVKYCCATQVDARGIIRPLIREILESCPDELKPSFKQAERAWVFPNGSRIELTGLDAGKAESIRGRSADLAIIDEAGIIKDLKYIIRSIILPTTTTTKGKIILASTPPKTYDHPFVEYINKARIENNLITKTIYDNPTIDVQELEKIIDEYGGIESIDFRREYLCHVIIDNNFAVVPEFTPEVEANTVKDWPRAAFYDAYVAMDLGFRDLTVVLFAWYDFKEAKIVVEDELVLHGQKTNTLTLAEGIRKKEASAFTDKLTGEQREPYMRVSDNNLMVLNDLWTAHGLLFVPTRKDDADAALNNMKIMIQNEKIIINPRCRTLISHLKSAVWNKSKTSYERSADSGHYDAIDALKYLVRNVQLTKNPYPSHYFSRNPSDMFQSTPKSNPHSKAWEKALNIKRNQ